MTTFIRIEEKEATKLPYEAVLRFSHGAEYPIRLNLPFDNPCEQQLKWYFDEYSRFPFYEPVLFAQYPRHIQEYGENLFYQVFADQQSYYQYQQALPTGLILEIIGSPTFQALHWETLKNPCEANAFAVQHRMYRKSMTHVFQPIIQQNSPVLNILLIVARPLRTFNILYRTISKPLVELIENTRLPVKIDILRPATYFSLIKHLEQTKQQHGLGYYHILHFDGYSDLLSFQDIQQDVDNYELSKENKKMFEDKQVFLFFYAEKNSNKNKPISADMTKCLLTQNHIPIMIFSSQAFNTNQRASEICLGQQLASAGIAYLSIPYPLTITAIQLFMQHFYKQLLQNRPFAEAVYRARFELHHKKQRMAYYGQEIVLEDWLLPIMYQQQNLILSLRPAKADNTSQSQQITQFENLECRFFGRDLEIVDIEYQLSRHNILLIKGLGGIGKTTLLHHLAYVWQATRFIERVFYFGYDVQAYTCDNLFDSIAQQLLSPSDYQSSFIQLSENEKQQKIVKQLRNNRYLLTLDNLESITGTPFSIANLLDTDQQKKLQQFLHALSGGQTLVLLSSNNEEFWLAKGTFVNNIYELTGLDEEAASQLADSILKARHVIYHKTEQYEVLQQVLKLLAGSPIAIIALFSNLTQKNLKTMLTTLTENGDSQDFDLCCQTKRILYCVSYSHSNIAPQIQEWLICFAPFVNVIYKKSLSIYINYLKQQVDLVHLFKNEANKTAWKEILKEIKKLGLIKIHPETNTHLQLHPILPNFLSFRLQTKQRIQQSVNIAFCRLYEDLSIEINGLLKSERTHEKELGMLFSALEYKNLHRALQLALAQKISVYHYYSTLSLYLFEQQDYTLGLEIGLEVRKALEHYPESTLKGELGQEFVNILEDLAKLQLLLKNYADAEYSYQQVLNLTISVKTLTSEQREKMHANICSQLGLIAEHQQHWQQAENYYHQALALRIKSCDNYALARTYYSLAVINQKQRRWQQAERYYQQALAAKTEPSDYHHQASIFQHLGSMAQELRNWQQAENYYQQALNIYSRFNDYHAQASIYQQLGHLAEKQQNWQQAESYYQNALTIYSEFNHYPPQASIYFQLGFIAYTTQQWQQAEYFYRQALAIYIELNDRQFRAIVYRQLGRVAEAQRHWLVAKDYFCCALRAFIELRDDANIKMTLFSLAKLHQQNHDEDILSSTAKIMDCSVLAVRQLFAKELGE